MTAPSTSPLAAAFPERPRPTKLGHIVLRTPQFEAMKAFYLTLLRGVPAYENAQVMFLTYDDEHHRIGIIDMPHLKPADPGAAGLEHISFTYADLASLLAVYLHNKASGLLPFWSINHGPTISLYYRDPDGNKIELQHDVFATTAEIETFFASGAYDENFMGIIFDPDRMVADYEAGVPIADLVRRPLLPAGVTPWDMHRH